MNETTNESLDLSVYNSIPASKVQFLESPLIKAKAIKNDVEVESMMTSSVNDAVALIEFFAHIEDDVTNGKKNYTELSAAELVRSNFKSYSLEVLLPLSIIIR